MNDGEKAGFWLICGVIVLYGVVIVSKVGLCIYHSESIVEGHIECDANGRLIELLTAALAAALAFSHSTKK